MEKERESQPEEIEITRDQFYQEIITMISVLNAKGIEKEEEARELYKYAGIFLKIWNESQLDESHGLKVRYYIDENGAPNFESTPKEKIGFRLPNTNKNE